MIRQDIKIDWGETPQFLGIKAPGGLHRFAFVRERVNSSIEEAYNRYGKGLEALTSDPKIGLSIVYAGSVQRFLIGGDEDWDRVLVVRYPSRQHMLTMMRDPRYQEAHRHREAGLKHQDLIETKALTS